MEKFKKKKIKLNIKIKCKKTFYYRQPPHLIQSLENI